MSADNRQLKEENESLPSGFLGYWKRLESFLSDLPVPKDLPLFWRQHLVAWRVLLLLIIGVAIFVATLPITLKMAGLSAFYFVIVAVAQFILAMLIMLLVMPPPPKNNFFSLLSKIISSVSAIISSLRSTPFTPPRSRATV